MWGIQGFLILTSSLMWRVSFSERYPVGLSTSVPFSSFDLFLDLGILSGYRLDSS